MAIEEVTRAGFAMAEHRRSVLLDPIRVGSVTLSSRIVMGSMHTGLECHPERFEQLGRFYAERAIYEGAILGNRI